MFSDTMNINVLKQFIRAAIIYETSKHIDRQNISVNERALGGTIFPEQIAALMGKRNTETSMFVTMFLTQDCKGCTMTKGLLPW